MMDFRLVVAWAWLAVAVLGTVLLAPHLGLRGWCWLGVHHVLCLAGCGDEIRRGRKRMKEKRAPSPSPLPAPQGQGPNSSITS
jgi:hypothetical protein